MSRTTPATSEPTGTMAASGASVSSVTTLFGGTMSTWRMPSTLRSWSAGTFIGPGEGACPAVGCGKAVDIAV